MKEDFASIDFETRGTYKLNNVGVHRYVEDPWFRPMCLGWAINNDPVQLWVYPQPPPKDLVRHVERGGMLHAWNAMFERLVWWNGLVKLGWPKPRYEQFRCTMVRSLAAGFPAALRWAAVAMKLEERKDVVGGKAMMKLSKPRRIELDGTPVWWDDLDLYAQMYSYCKQDVITERAAGELLPYLPESEERQYWYDQRVADRGIRLDRDLCLKALKVVNVRRAELNKMSQRISGFLPTQVSGVTDWINRQNYVIPNLQARTVNRVMRDPKLPKRVKEVLKIRQEAGKTSTAKYEAALMCVCRDGTLKGQRQFFGAHTGRWAGRLVQLDNLMRPTMKGEEIEDIVQAIKTGDSGLVESAYDNVMEPVANAVRGMLVADEGEHLYVGDYKSIESRMLALMSGQQSKLDQWRASDEGRGPDVYVMNAAQMFNCSIKEAAHKDKRFWGKTSELLLGYEGGCAPLLRNQITTDIFFRDIYDIMFKNASDDTRQKVDWLWKKMGKVGEHYNEKDWRAARFVVEKWRSDNPMSVRLWGLMKKASIKAVANPGKRFAARGIIFEYDTEYKSLKMNLMSGRPLYYPFAHTVVGKNFKGEDELELRAYYLNQYHQWVRYNPYGGFLTENADQAQSRDVMSGSFKPLEQHGFKLRHTVHDELICSAKKGSSLSTFVECATIVPKWARGIPLALDAWCGPRYRKGD